MGNQLFQKKVDKQRVSDSISFEQSAWFLYKPEQPFETNTLNPLWCPFFLAD
ncbi:hypothetical protein BN8_06529 [Fibrisoma limi BUZ 3]|uniref:Uncharacterized protein n=1 Tax=Fibrisoma limi BUZ 3 TaxID=1185876 RepID=I2GT96_9BACT|nr:hypothetical protein BN8_06529 [Fibrisoma limi BUZ 3]